MTNSETIIEPCKGWKVRGMLYPVLLDAQIGAIARVLGMDDTSQTPRDIVDHAKEIIAILKMEPPKTRKQRSDAGTKRTKKIAPVSDKISRPVMGHTKGAQADPAQAPVGGL